MIQTLHAGVALARCCARQQTNAYPNTSNSQAGGEQVARTAHRLQLQYRQTQVAFGEMLESMRTGKTGVHQKTLNRLTRFMDEFKQLNFVGDREMEAQLDRVRQEFLLRSAEDYRVAQEALTNVARHAHASRVEVSIQKMQNRVCMKIKDDGKSFDVERVLRSKGNGRLGLLGMRERVEMVGGSLDVESAPGQGTTIRAEIPFTNHNRV